MPFHQGQRGMGWHLRKVPVEKSQGFTGNTEKRREITFGEWGFPRLKETRAYQYLEVWTSSGEVLAKRRRKCLIKKKYREGTRCTYKKKDKEKKRNWQAPGTAAMEGERWYKGTLEVLDNLGSYSGKYQAAISAITGKKKISRKENIHQRKRSKSGIIAFWEKLEMIKSLNDNKIVIKW